MRHEALFEALVHGGDHCCLGRRLRPLTLYHWFWLDALDHPILRDKPLSAAALEQAVAVCAADYGELPRAILRKGLGRRLRFGLGWLVWWRMEKEVARFSAYWRDYFAMPDLWQEQETEQVGEEEVETVALPAHFRTAARLMRAGMSRREAWMTPVGEAQFLATVWAEQEGAKVNWVTEQERQFMEAMRLEKEAAARAAAAKAD